MKRAHSLFAGTLALVLLGTACSAPHEPQWPTGAVLIARSESVTQLFERLSELEGTPLARRAGALAAELSDCEILEAHAESGALAELWSSLRCHEPGGALARAAETRGSHDAIFALPLRAEAEKGRDAARLLGTLDLSESGDVELRLSIPPDAFDDARTLLLPGSEPPGPDVLSGTERLIHARVRPRGGIDFARFVPDGGQADRLFALKSEIFAGAVLDGTWEAAVYLPEPGRSMPRTVLAFGFSQRVAAQKAMDTLLAGIAETWSLRVIPFAVAGSEGRCIPALKLLPELAPCYVATENALLVGWNPASLRKALDEERAPVPSTSSRATLELARFREADALLAMAHRIADTSALGPVFPWLRLQVEGRLVGRSVELLLQLQGSPEGNVALEGTRKGSPEGKAAS